MVSWLLNHTNCSLNHANCSLDNTNCSLNHANCFLNQITYDGFLEQPTLETFYLGPEVDPTLQSDLV